MSKIKSYTISSEVLGQGASGIVYKAFDAKEMPTAAKRIDGSQHPESEKYFQSRRYKKLLQLQHRNILQILDTEKVGKLFWIFVEFCEIGDLNKFYSSKDVTIDTSEEIMKQTMRGIAYLHDQDIIHRDIKPGNILVASEYPLVVKLTDFDFTKCLNLDIETSGMSSNVGTNVFKAPEFFMRNERNKINYHQNVDTYAAGLSFLAILQYDKKSLMLIPHIETARHDFELLTPIGQLIAERIKYSIPELDIVLSDTLTTERASAISEESLWKQKIKNLIQLMTHYDPWKRPTAFNVMAALEQVFMLNLYNRASHSDLSCHSSD